MRTLVLIPSPLEYQRLVTRHGETLTGPFLACREGEWTWAVCGIGPAASACSAAMLSSLLEPERVILLGIAGAYPNSSLKIGDLVQARSECFADLGAVENEQPRSLEELCLPHLPFAGEILTTRFTLEPLLPQLRAADFATVSTITSDTERAKRLASHFTAEVENMEGAGVALACRMRGIAFHELRVISNEAGPRDPKSWPIEQVLSKLRRAVENISH